jgi:ferredoxin
MADPDNKHPLNLPGAYYNDDTCVDCDLCREIAPQFFRRDDASAASYVWHQPETLQEIALAEEVRLSCPTESIGNDGRP